MIWKNLEQTLTLVALAATLGALVAWMSTRRDRENLQATLSAQKEVIAAAKTREIGRATALDKALAQIERLKHSINTPAEVVNRLPRYLPLPQPITFPQTPATLRLSVNGSAEATTTATPVGDPKSGQSSADHEALASSISDSALLPNADLKPLFDFVQASRECQLELVAARQSSTDGKTMLAAALKERDAAVQATKGGSLIRHLRRDIAWLASGILVGYAIRR